MKRQVSMREENNQQIVNSLFNFSQEGLFRMYQNKITYSNGSFLKLFGLNELQEIDSQSFYTLLVDEEVASLLREKIETRNINGDERLLFRRLNGSNFWGSFICHHLDNCTIEGCIRDISGLKMTEENLMEKELELEKMKNELDRFIYSASHDIRSPISSTKGIINLMRMELKDGASDKYINMMESSLNKLDSFISELTSFAKTSRQPVRDRLVHFDTLLRNVLDELASHAKYTFARIETAYAADGAFYSDVDRIQLALLNVIKNALDYQDFRKKSNMITVDIKCMTAICDITVFDNGIGIAPIYIERVFDMFYKATDVSKGSGLGLYITREAVRKLGGIVTISSRFGVGTSVKISIPNSKKGRLVSKKQTLRGRIG